MPTHDPRVDDYLAPLPDWQRAVGERVRALVHEADPDVEETVKRRVQPYFVLPQDGRAGNVAALLATKDHVNVFLYDGGLTPDPKGLITGGHDNTTGRTIAIYEDDELDEAALLAMFRHIVGVNRRGGWRRVKDGR